MAPARGRGPGGAGERGVGRDLLGGVASLPGRSWAAGAQRLPASERASGRARSFCALGRRLRASLAQLRSRLRGWEPGPALADAERPVLPTPARLPQGNRSGAGGGGEGARPETGGLKVWKVSGTLRPSGWGSSWPGRRGR